MKNLAPHIFRQRLLIEGFYKIQVDEKVIKEYFHEVTNALQLRMYGEPIIFSPEGLGQKENQGYDAFVPLIDSGISVYIWSNAKFLSIVIYTCKGFDENRAIEVTKNFFEIDDIEFQSF
jgi:S-adenosylmethionine decarboxylase